MARGKTIVECRTRQSVQYPREHSSRSRFLHKKKQEVLLYWRQEKSSSTVLNDPFSFHEPFFIRPSIIWELSGDPCATQEEALSGIKHDTEAFIICNRGNEFLQAACNDPESYHCEISFVNGKNRELYIAPKDLDYS